MCTRNAQNKSQEKLEVESAPSLLSGSLAHQCCCLSPATIGRCTPPPGPGSYPARGHLQHTCQSTAKHRADASLQSPFLEPPSPKNPSWKLCRPCPQDNSSLALPPGCRDASQHNSHCSSLSCDLEMSWSSLPPPSRSALELQEPGRGGPPPPNSQPEHAPRQLLQASDAQLALPRWI